MEETTQQTVLLGVTGSIAAYKACELLRLLQKAGFRVKVVMTESANELVGAATFRALSGEPVATSLFDDPREPINHISLGESADVFVIAPCTANVINKLANGVADDLLTTTALATTAPLVIAPAMNVLMLQNSRTQESLRRLEASGTIIVGPGEGYLACGTEDSGRMSEPEDICAATLEVLSQRESLEGKRVLITTGATREFLDPVRYISSPASGRTGFALAEEAALRGAEVVLVSGPTELLCPPKVKQISVVSARDMLKATQQYFDNADIALFSAAVADFRPLHTAAQKLKKGKTLPARGARTDATPAPAFSSSADGSAHAAANYDLTLTANPDILATMAARRHDARNKKPFIVGFAAETEDVLANAQAKLKAKGADLIIANDVSNPQQGFASTHNEVIFVDAHTHERTELMSKTSLARVIFDHISAKL